VGLGAIVKRIDRVAGRVNRWLGPAALASNTQKGTTETGGVDASRVTAILGELEKPAEGDREV
jgi:hypothetical protein